MQTEPRYLALIGDVAGSRELAERARLQVELERALARRNRVHAASLAAPLTVAAGDEFMALFSWPGELPAPEGRIVADAVIETVTGVAAALHPVALRFGLGGGGLSTPRRAEAPLGMDGPCFHRARGALALSKGERRLLTASGLTGDPEPGTLGGEADIALTALLGLIGALMESWTPRQMELALDPERGLTRLKPGAGFVEGLRKDVAAAFGVSPSVVTESMQAARYDHFRFGLWSAGLLLFRATQADWWRRRERMRARG